MTSSTLAFALALLLACGCRSERLPSTDAGVDGATGGAESSGGNGSGGQGKGGQGNAGLPSLEVTVETVSNGGESPCGPGCRLALQRPVEHGGLIPHAFSSTGVADTNTTELLYADLGSNTTQVVRDGAALIYREGSLISYVSVPDWPVGDIVVLDTATRRRTTYFHFEDGQAYGSPFETLLSDEYLFWMRRSATSRANLRTGEVTQQFSAGMQCDSGCAAGGKILCLDGSRIIAVDQQTGSSAYLDDSAALQFHATCSADRKRMAWVDFRDPPGQTSSYFGAHIGGEIYVYDVDTEMVRRLTHDSPGQPITKSGVGIGADLAVWFEPCLDCKKNFDLDHAQDFWDTPVALVRLELATNRRCRLDRRTMGGHLSLHGHHVYGYWTDTVNQYLVDLDLDEPSLPWICE